MNVTVSNAEVNPIRHSRLPHSADCDVIIIGAGPYGLSARLDDGSEREVDHVLVGTGHRVDIANYVFLSDALKRQICKLDGYPQVGSGLCSSVPNLHFVGAAAARNFGPLLNFVTGTEFASEELTSYVKRMPV